MVILSVTDERDTPEMKPAGIETIDGYPPLIKFF